MKRARVGRRRDKLYRARTARVAHIGDREAVRKHVPDKGVPLVDHDLHAVAPAGLVAMSDEFDVARGNGDHGAAPPLCIRPSYRQPHSPSVAKTHFTTGGS